MVTKRKKKIELLVQNFYKSLSNQHLHTYDSNTVAIAYLVTIKLSKNLLNLYRSLFFFLSTNVIANHRKWGQGWLIQRRKIFFLPDCKEILWLWMFGLFESLKFKIVEQAFRT